MKMKSIETQKNVCTSYSPPGWTSKYISLSPCPLADVLVLSFTHHDTDMLGTHMHRFTRPLVHPTRSTSRSP